MSQLEELKSAFKNCAGPFPVRDFERLLGFLNYESLKTGKTGGSRRKFINRLTNHKIFYHEPHEKEFGQEL